MLENKKELEDLKSKLEAIRSIVEHYKKQDCLHTLRNRIERFCELVAFSCFFLSWLYLSMFCSAITRQLESIEDMQKHRLWARVAEGTKDANTILKAIRNINSLCDVFQVGFRVINKVSRRRCALLKMDTQLNVEGMVGDILQVWYSRYFQA